MKRKSIVAALAAAALVITAVAAGTAGTKSDPLISKSYLDSTYRSSVVNTAAEKTAAALAAAEAETAVPQTTEEYAAYAADLLAPAGGGYTKVPVQPGTVISGGTGTQLFVWSGTVSLSGGRVLDLTAGSELQAGSLIQYHSYLVPEETTASFTAVSAGAVYAKGTFSKADGESYLVQYTSYGDALYSLGLFRGTETGYELDRQSTRIEGVVMLLRLLGEEEAALSYGGSHPFADVPAWADRYVAYAYHMGYTNGTSATTYTPNGIMTGNQFLTFILRALQYDDGAGDFVWNSAVDFAQTAGVLSPADAAAIQAQRYFYRDNMVYVSYLALGAGMKHSADTLADVLIAKGIFSREQYRQTNTML